jgi:hypothetical protein
MSALQAGRGTPQRSFGSTEQKTTFEPIRVPRDALEAFRKTEPLFTEFLIETGRVVVENMPGKPMGAR